MAILSSSADYTEMRVTLRHAKLRLSQEDDGFLLIGLQIPQRAKADGKCHYKPGCPQT
jgi:hypothetical protein